MALGVNNIEVSGSHTFSTYSPGGTTLFYFIIVYNGSKLRTGGVCDDVMPGATIGWWLAI